MPPTIPTCTVTAKPHTVTRSPTTLSDNDSIAPAQRPMRPPSKCPRRSPAHLTNKAPKEQSRQGQLRYKLTHLPCCKTSPIVKGAKFSLHHTPSNEKHRQKTKPTLHPRRQRPQPPNAPDDHQATSSQTFTWPGLKAQTRAQTVVTTKPQLPPAFRLVCQATHADPQAQQRTQHTVHTTGCWQQKRPRSICPRSTHQRCCKGEQDVAGTAPQPERRSNAEPCLPKIVQDRSIRDSGLSVRNVHLNKTPQGKCLSLSGATMLISTGQRTAIPPVQGNAGHGQHSQNS